MVGFALYLSLSLNSIIIIINGSLGSNFKESFSYWRTRPFEAKKKTYLFKFVIYVGFKSC